MARLLNRKLPRIVAMSQYYNALVPPAGGRAIHIFRGIREDNVKFIAEPINDRSPIHACTKHIHNCLLGNDDSAILLRKKGNPKLR
ncbi:hypothetical protein Q3G72_022028 [Acer saccharum]|nr:hypothetical protein Q3G72_022028 [Acer saccharum]